MEPGYRTKIVQVSENVLRLFLYYYYYIFHLEKYIKKILDHYNVCVLLFQG